jgi:lipoprotein-anchoring transpeptidase ErfK/SrfK
MTRFAALLGLVVLMAPATALAAPVSVAFEGYEMGTIVVKTSARKLYFVTGFGTALRYPIAVGRNGKQWTGERTVDGKYVRPAWSPPDEIRRDKPTLPDVIPGGHPSNPMGERVISIGADYAIHGTNRRSSIGTFASYGCIRMYNEDVIHLYERVSVGTRVVVLP